jgi:glycogen phosphorylase
MNKKRKFGDIHVAYFSMEIGIDPAIPTYSGGLGVLAGDTLRSAADLELPIIGVTLLYNKGYFKQNLDENGNQSEEEVFWKPANHLERVKNTITVNIEGRDVIVSAWLYWINGTTGQKNPIVFLDTDHPNNSELDRGITKHLYGGDEKYRLSQEIVLGIGGVRILEAIGCGNLQKYHMNEGHSALLTLELCSKADPTSDVIDAVREKCVFTTHTPVPAGHDQFEMNLAKSMLGDMIPDDICDELFWEGKLNMTHVGLRFSDFINGVAKKHGEVSRGMFPGYHIESITNGVHSGFWTSPPFARVFDKFLPGWRIDPFNLRYVLSIPKEKIWDAHQESKKKLIEKVNSMYGKKMDADTFTIGFARRSATYKRGDMLFNNIERLRTIAKQHKIQIIYAGKAHPHDGAGKDIIRHIFKSMKDLAGSIEVCYVADYDIELAKMLVSGVDVWLNTPMRPHEASGTSGMKAAMNGVPHFSVLDGWWLEGHIEKVTGFSIGEHPRDPSDDDLDDTEDMYRKLEYVILPRFYNERDKWVDMMRHTIAMNGSYFNTHRMVQQYVLNAYFK